MSSLSYDGWNWQDMNVDGVEGLVGARIDQSHAYADASIAAMNHFIGSISHIDFTSDLDQFQMEGVESWTVGSILANPPNLTPSPGLHEFIPETMPTMSGDLVTIEVPNVDIPVYNLLPPTLNIAPLPDVTWPVQPGASPGVGEIPFPETPALVLPDPPSLDEIVLPGAPDLSLPVFEGIRPDDDLNPPGELFAYNEDEYASELQTELYEKIRADLAAGGTGLGATVEEAMWQRARDRLDVELERHYDEIDSGWEARGFAFPPGLLLAAKQRARSEIDAKKVDLNRDIAVEQARLAQEYSKFIVEKAIELERQLITHANEVANRAFQAARAGAEFGLAVYEARVRTFEARIEMYKADAAVFRDRLQGALAELEVYKARLEGARIQADIQERYIQIYTARLGAVQLLVEIYRTEMDSARIRAEVEKTRIQAYGEEINAYSAVVRANAAIYDANRVQIEGELAKARVFAEQVNGFRAQVEAAGVEAEVRKTQADVALSRNASLIEIYKADLDGYRTQISGMAAALSAIASLETVHVGSYDAQVRGYAAQMSAHAQKYSADVSYSAAQAHAAASRAAAQAQHAVGMAQVQVQAVNAQISANAQITAATLAQVNTTLSMGVSSSMSQNQSQSQAQTNSQSSNSNVSASQSHNTTHQYIYSA